MRFKRYLALLLTFIFVLQPLSVAASTATQAPSFEDYLFEEHHQKKLAELDYYIQHLLPFGQDYTAPVFTTPSAIMPLSTNLIASGTMGRVGNVHGAAWRLYLDGHMVVQPGYIFYNGVTPPWSSRRNDIRTITFTGRTTLSHTNLSLPATARSLFANLPNLTTINGLANLDTSNITDMGWLFSGARSLINLDLSSFDTSNVTDMRWSFSNASSLTNLDLSNFDTSNVTNMNSMFLGTSNLINLDLSSFNTSNVTDMEWMFSNASSLTNLDLSNFNTNNVTNMRGMFWDVSSLINLDLSNFDTSSVTDMSTMFMNASSLTSLDLSNFDTSNATHMNSMFLRASNLTSLDLSSFDTRNATNMLTMFGGTSSLNELTLGRYFYLQSSITLPNPPRDNPSYTGNWILVGNGTVESPAGPYTLTGSQFTSVRFNPSTMHGTWVWERVAADEEQWYTFHIDGYYIVYLSSDGRSAVYRPIGSSTGTILVLDGDDLWVPAGQISFAADDTLDAISNISDISGINARSAPPLLPSIRIGINIQQYIDTAIRDMENEFFLVSGLNRDLLTPEDMRMVMLGITHAVDENLFFGLAQWITRSQGYDDNYFYLKAKSTTTSFFIAHFGAIAGVSAANAIKSLGVAGASGKFALATAPSGAGAVAGGVTAAGALTSAAVSGVVSVSASAMMSRSVRNFGRDVRTLNATPPPRAAFGDLSRAHEFGIQPYYKLKQAKKGTGLHAHHLVEKRFETGITDAAAVTPTEHQVFTNAWRHAIPYGSSKNVPYERLWEVAQEVYRHHPALLDAVRKALGF